MFLRLQYWTPYPPCPNDPAHLILRPSFFGVDSVSRPKQSELNPPNGLIESLTFMVNFSCLFEPIIHKEEKPHGYS